MAFDWQGYLNNYPDLRKAGITTANSAMEHWLSHGKSEGRTCERQPNMHLIDWKMYIDIYPDLRAAGIATDTDAARHWKKHGAAEDRIIYPIYNIEFPRVIRSTTIPKVIYQTWATMDLPSDVANAVKQMQQANRQFEHHVFDDNKRRAFIKANFQPQVLYAYDSLVPDVYKADLWTYCVLYLNGGIYVDINTVPIDGFSFNSIVDRDEFFCYNTDTGQINTALMICLPGNTVMKRCIDAIYKNVLTRSYGSSVSDPTGSNLISKYVTNSDSSMEYSNNSLTIDDIKLLHITDNSQGIAECSTLWENNQIYEDLDLLTYL